MPTDTAPRPLIEQILAVLVSLIFSTMAMVACYQLGEGWPGLVRLGGFAVTGFAAGLAQGRLFGSAYARHIAVGAFVGLLILWIGPTIISYGFALLFVPVLAVYAWVIGYGARCSYWLRGAPTAPLDQ